MVFPWTDDQARWPFKTAQLLDKSGNLVRPGMTVSENVQCLSAVGAAGFLCSLEFSGKESR